MNKKILILILALICVNPAFSKTPTKHVSKPFQASIFTDAPVESPDYLSAQGDKILNHYEKLQDKSGQERLLTAAKYFYFQANKLDISNQNAYIGRARIALFQDNVRDAKNNLFMALNFNENNPKVTYYMGNAFFKDGDFDDAINYYLHAYNHGYRLNYNTNLKLGICYEKMDDSQRAKYHYKNAMKILPSQAEPRLRLQGLDIINAAQSTVDVFKKKEKAKEKEEDEPLLDEEIKSLPAE